MRSRKQFATDLGPSRDGVGILCDGDGEAEQAIRGLRQLGCKNVARYPLALPGTYVVTTTKEMKRVMHWRDGKTVRRRFSTKQRSLRKKGA